MPIIIPFDTGWSFIQHMIDKFRYLILLWTWIFSNFVITRIHASIKHVYNTAWNLLPERNSTPDIRRDKNCHKPSHGAGIFFANLRDSKQSWYNERNCKSGRHSRRHTFMHRKPGKTCKDTNPTKLLDTVLKVKARKDGATKFPPPRRCNRNIGLVRHT